MPAHAYPKDIAAIAWKTWRERTCGGVLPDQHALEQLLSVAYQASLLHEEDRPVRFRLYLGDPASVPEDSGPPEGLHRLRFTEPRAFDEVELRRLAPAAKYHRSLIGVSHDGNAFRIWGMLQSGPRWLESARGGRAIASPVPFDAVVVSALDVGHILVSVGDVRLAELRGGRLAPGGLDLFDAEWMREQFDGYRRALIAEYEHESGIVLDLDGVRRISQQMVKRLLATMRDAHHGGMLLYVPQERAADLLKTAIHLKYAFADDAARRRYPALMHAVMHALGAAAAEMSPPPARVGYDVYQRTSRPEIAALDEAIFEISQLLAGLGDVDGAVVITDQLELLGFGAEIVGVPDVTTVRHAQDLEATEFHVDNVDRVGTRHRSAYRLCAFEPACLAIVVSQDGGVQFVKSIHGAVTFWDHGQALI